ncbi:uncharacterized protein LOC120662583 [Panicum virgatum]|uniref:uncharacterized protein LOC120662583 n=1 Tax=Panicum virgatum TaxID=38727 RepID=UPI0019D668D2|nr:uncharacterized protein LOC120662583 [Panicum virgatum]
MKSAQAAAFFLDIVHRFGVSNSIFTDNGTNFTGNEFIEFCDDHHIRVDWAAVAHPHTNGSEAILPTDLEYGSPRVKADSEQGSDAALEDAMDQLDEARDVVLLRSAKYQQALHRYHHRRVRGHAFNLDDLVL